MNVEHETGHALVTTWASFPVFRGRSRMAHSRSSSSSESEMQGQGVCVTKAGWALSNPSLLSLPPSIPPDDLSNANTIHTDNTL